MFYLFYLQVTSKPDLYPLVFSCTGDTGKGGTNYLMVQYFRNYIVRPVGSLSAASTVDSLSSSFIRNEANTLVPPPYSRATSPDLSLSLHNYAIPRSSSQQACSLLENNNGTGSIIYRPCSVPNSQLQSQIRLSGTGQMSESDALEFQNYVDAFQYQQEIQQQQQQVQLQHSSQPMMFNQPHPASLSMFPSYNQGGGQIQLNGILTNNFSQSNLSQIIDSGSNCSNGGTSTNSVNLVNSLDEDSDVKFVHNADTGSVTVANCVDGKLIQNSQGASELLEEDDEEYELLQRNLSQYRKILKLQMDRKESTLNFESRDNSQTTNTSNGIERSYFNSNTDSSVSSLANINSPTSPPRPTSPTNEVREILEQIRQIQSEADSAFFDTLETISNEAFHSTPNAHVTKNKPPPAPNVHLPPPSLSRKNIRTTSNYSIVNHSNNNTPNDIGLTNTSYSYHGGMSSGDDQINSPIPNVLSHSKSSSNGSCSNNMSGKISSNCKSNSASSSVRRKLGKTNRNLYLPITNNHHLLKPGQHTITTNATNTLRNSLTSNCILNRGRGTKMWISKSAPTTPGCGLPGAQLGIDDSSPLLDEHDEDAEQNG